MLTRLGKFDILRLLAQGSMGDVYVGRDPIIGREVAIKVIQASAAAGPEARERFAREARAAGALNHPNIVTIHEMGEEQGVLYLAMELVKGEDLATLIRAGTLSPRDTLEVLAQVCDGLAVAHQHQVLHRDIKPSNIRVVWDGKALQAKVLDFGVAKIFNTDTTDEGIVFGTVTYMAPEYLQGGRPDARSDLFAVGVVLYETLTGIPPFDGPNPGAVIYRLLHEPPPPLLPTASHGISRDVQNLLSGALAKDPAHRFQSAEALAAALRAAKDPNWRWSPEYLHAGPLPPRVAPAPFPAAPGPRPVKAQEATAPRELPASAAASPASPGRPRDTPSARLPSPASGPRRAAGAGGTAPAPDHEEEVPREKRPAGQAEVRKDVLETTRRQLLQALAIDPGNAKAHAMLLVTLYRLGWGEAMMQSLRHARDGGIPAPLLKAVPRCAQLVDEEAATCHLPLELHQEFMAYLGD
ncbi:serine/threonine-protein kinase [Geothrix paludis]|uniref:serine/threonine-protein kinase n=1 Tax=Geothrix paludis TaxID=2922722 RepID=UPI001FAD98AA